MIDARAAVLIGLLYQGPLTADDGGPVIAAVWIASRHGLYGAEFEEPARGPVAPLVPEETREALVFLRDAVKRSGVVPPSVLRLGMWMRSQLDRS